MSEPMEKPEPLPDECDAWLEKVEDIAPRHGCHNCLYGIKGGWRVNNAWPCNVCRIGPNLCCGEDNWKPNSTLDNPEKGK